MKNLSTNELLTAIVLHFFLAIAAAYEVWFEEPRSILHKIILGVLVCTAAIISICLYIKKSNEEKNKDAKLKVAIERTINQDKMLRILSYGLKPNKKISQLMREAFLYIGTDDLGLDGMIYCEYGDKILLKFTSENKDKYPAFIILDTTAISDIFYSSKSIEFSDIKASCKEYFINRSFFRNRSDENELSENIIINQISQFILECLRADDIVPQGEQAIFINRNDCIFYALLTIPITKPNNHTKLIEITDKEGEKHSLWTYWFTKDQYDELRGKSRFEVSQIVLKWFDDIGIQLFEHDGSEE